MATLATLVVDLIAETAKFMEGMDKAVSKMDATAGKMKDIGSSMTGAGKKLTLGLTTPILGAGAFAVKAASDIEESANAVNVVFGDSAGEILKWGDVAATQAGLARSEFYQMSAQTGAMLQNMGIDQAAAADESINLAQRAADMASIFNTDVDQALGAIQAGLRGEIDPLERFGVSMNQSAVAAKAIEMGLIDSASEMDNNAKAQATLALLYEQTESVAGDFVNTSDGVANSMRIAEAMVKDVGGAFGNDMMPYIQQGIGFLRQLLNQFMALTPEQRSTILTVLGLAAAIGPLLIVLGTLISSVGTVIGAVSSAVGIFSTIAGVLIGPVGLAIAAIVAAVIGLYLAWQNNFLGIQQVVGAVVQFLVNLWNNVLLPAFKAVGNFISLVIAPIFMGIADVLSAVVGVAVTALAGLWQNVLQPALAAVWSWISGKIMPIFKAVANVVQTILGPPLQWLNDNVVQPLIHGFGGIVSAVQKVVQWLKDLADKIRNIRLPDWLTPGSPTPFEIGLRGIADALRMINRTELPSLGASLGDLSLASIPALSAPAPVMRGGDTIYHFYNAPIENQQSLTRRIREMQMLNGA